MKQQHDAVQQEIDELRKRLRELERRLPVPAPPTSLGGPAVPSLSASPTDEQLTDERLIGEQLAGREPASETLANGKDSVAQLFAGSPVGLAVFDEQLDCAQANRVYQELHQGSEQNVEVQRKLRHVAKTGIRLEEERCTAGGVFGWFYTPVFGTRKQVQAVAVTVVDVSQLKRAELETADREEKFRLIFERVPECVKILTGDGILEDMNPAGLELIEAEELGQVRGQSIYPIIAPEYREEFIAKAEAVQRGERTQQQFEIIGLQGKRRWMETEQVPLRFGTEAEPRVLAVTRDISERKNADEQRRSQEKWFRAIFEQAGLAVGVVDSVSGTLVRVNSKYEELVGYTQEELTKLTWQQITHPADIQADADLMEQLLAGHIKEFSINKRLLHKSGRPISIHLTVSAMWGPGDTSRQHIVMLQDVTERIRAEEELRFSAAITENMREGIALTRVADGTIVFTNPRFNEIFGYGVGELIGQHPEVLRSPHATVPAAKRAAEILRDAGENGVWAGQIHNVRKDGRDVWTSANITIFEHADHGLVHLSVVEDITAKKRADDLLQALLEGTAASTGGDFFAAFAASMAKALNTRYVLVCEHLDSPPTRVRTLANWSGGRIREDLEFDLAGTPCGETASGQRTFYRAGLGTIFADSTIIQAMEAESYCGLPIRDSNGTILGHIAIVDDRPLPPDLAEIPALDLFSSRMAGEMERRRYELQLGDLQEKLAHVTRVSTMGEMATGLAHELNQPLNAIAAYSFAAENILAGRDQETAPEQDQLLEILQDISVQTLRAGEIIRRLRALVKKRASKRELRPIDQPIRDVLKLLENTLQHLGVQLHLEIDATDEVWIDEIQIQQVLVNIIRNGLDAMVDTPVSERALTIKTRLDDSHGAVEIAVSDSGCGFGEQSQERVFSPFFTTKPDGIGMGLAISRTILQSHGGDLSLEANPGPGVTVRLQLPTRFS